MKTERLPVNVFPDDEEASAAVAERIATLIRQRCDQGKPTVLGLATGHTPVNVYRRLIEMHRDEGLDLAGVITFNLDEYWPIDPSAVQSYHKWMSENFFRHVNIRPENIHIPPGNVPEEQVASCCRKYEEQIVVAGGIDIQILGIGRTGHIGFNEPGSSRNGRTRMIHLDGVTRQDAAGDFFGIEHVPKQAITMGVGTIMEARCICLLAFGEHKAPIIRRAVEEPVFVGVSASYLQDHPDAAFYLDAPAAGRLTRTATPWLIGPCQWDEKLTRKAVIWLALELGKTILALTDEDYAENGLGELLAARGGAYDVNLAVFKRMMNTISGWPAGKEPGRKVLIFSPHPDDDVISMGSTLSRLARQGHDVHVAYQTSGNLAVFDHDVLRFAEFATKFNQIFGLALEQTVVIDDHIEKFLRNKETATIDSQEVLQVKTLIRKTESIAAAGFCGIPKPNCHFLEMPFYQTGTVQKLSIGDEDTAVVFDILSTLQPDIVFAAGDLSDPHGTHRMCLDALLRALRKYKQATGAAPVMWFYRGAWQEWEPCEIDMAVPISPDELNHKRHAIFRHESQKDRAMFPGPYDVREFWQRAEDRNRNTADVYDKLGLPEYHGIETFVRWERD